MLIDLVARTGIQLKKVSSTRGGEYKGPCPACGGKDRFFAQPKAHDGKGYYQCRQCKINGDSIQFCKDFLGMSFKEAIQQTGDPRLLECRPPIQAFIDPVNNPPPSWQRKAREFCEISHRNLLKSQEALAFMKKKYGINTETIRQHYLGWNPEKTFQYRSEWGLDELTKKLCLPKGPVFAGKENGEIFKIKIRDCDWSEGNIYGKYKQVPGSSNRMSIIGHLENPIPILVESEFDATLLAQEIGSGCTCVALGGATKRPDPITYSWLQRKELVLYSLDFDEAGRESYSYWKNHFSNLRAWPSETRKSPADSFLLDGIDPKKWFETGVQHWEKSHLTTGKQ